MKRKSKVAFGKLGLVLALTTAVFLGLVGVAVGQLSQTVTASYTSDYAPATCVLSVASAGPTIPAVLDLSSGGGTLYVENSGLSDSAGNPSNMNVNVAFQDDGLTDGSAYGGWYQGSTWIPGMSTTWTSNIGPYTVEGVTGNAQGAAYSGLPSGSGATWEPIDFSVTAPATLPAGLYNQQVVFTGSGC